LTSSASATPPVADAGAGAPVGGHAKAGAAALTLGALGVVFGDIGTSPLYALQQVFRGAHTIQPNPERIYGVLSLIFWSVTIIVSIKYVTFIMRADNDGEGGIMALVSLVQRAVMKNSKRNKMVLIALGVFGASLFYGDGMITPAISVLSAVEGLKVVSPSLSDYVLPIALAVLTMLFLIQRFGTGAVGNLFGPVMALWFGVLAILGGRQVVEHPAILRALSPSYAVSFFVDDGVTAFLALASVVLAVTGAEALYADMGHFGRSPIRRAWFMAAFPALMLNYLGQGSLLITTPSAVDNPFYRLVPDRLQVPMVVLATIATVIASQAVISGAFSVTRQAVQLGFLPRLTITHTSQHSAGQVYVPAVNWTLYVAIVGLVLGFRTSSHLASAYGIAVTGTLAIDTLLFFVVVHTVWKKSLKIAIAGAAAFLIVDLSFFAANLTKIVHGGWFPIVIALSVFTVLMTWQRGRAIVTRNRMLEEGSLTAFINELASREPPIVRVPGCAVFLNASPDTTPLALRHNVMHNHVLHERVVIVTVESKRVPHVAPADRIAIDDLGDPSDGILLLHARFGFQDHIDVPAALRLAVEQGGEGSDIDVDNASYFLSRITITPTRAPGMAGWRKRLFVAMSRNAASPASYFGLPEDRVIALGSEVDL
jgi:KUP system potassium uptake protein